VAVWHNSVNRMNEIMSSLVITENGDYLLVYRLSM